MNARSYYLWYMTLSVSLLSSSLFSFIATPYDPAHCTLATTFAHDASSSCTIGVTQTTGSQGYDAEERSVPFAEQYGTVRAADLLIGLGEPESGSLAEKYLTSDGSEYIGDNAIIRFNGTGNSYRFKSLHADITQHIISNLFVQCTAQFVTQEITLRPRIENSDAAPEAFLADFDQLLAEYNLPALSYNKRPFTLERLAFFVGWGEHTKLVNSIFQEIGGTLSAGYVITPPAFEHPLCPALLAYNINDGFIARATGRAQLLTYIDARLDASTTIYNERCGTMRVVQDDSSETPFYSGPFLLGTGFVKKNPGSLWTLLLTIGVNRVFGCYANAGYHFSYQETTALKLRDTNTLSALDDRPAHQEIRLNTDPKLRRWKYHALTFSCGFEPTYAHGKLIPRIEGRIFLPLWGHHTVEPSQSISGQAGITFQWKW